MEKERILKAYNDYLTTDIYKNCSKYRNLSDGKSADVFFNDVKARVNMEYMGIVNKQGYMNTYSMSNGNLVSDSKGCSLKDLVVGNGILQATTRLYSEYATSKPLITNQEDLELIIRISSHYNHNIIIAPKKINGNSIVGWKVSYKRRYKL